MNIWEKYYISFEGNREKTAFFIDGKSYSYSEFLCYIQGSYSLLQAQTGGSTGLPIGVYCHDCIETYAAIFAIWFSGCIFIPLNPHQPNAVNREKVDQSNIQYLFSPIQDELHINEQVSIINNRDIIRDEKIVVAQEQGIAYILFTSGSTGKPKGVQITTRNLETFIDGFNAIYPDLSSEDRFLQTYELTSDAAFTGYLIPLLLGATVYTIPSGSIKYLMIIKMLQKHDITWTQFTPSVLSYLQPYLNSIRLDHLRHSHFGGEALPIDRLLEWSVCVPNAELSNIYGPTETTITCAIHRTEPADLRLKVFNGIVSIGLPLKGVKVLIVDEQDAIITGNEKGELCIGGDQVMSGYLNGSRDDKRVYFEYGDHGSPEIYYRSGDLVVRDAEGYLYYCGRKDDQLKISGYRVEPAEIEWAVSQVTGGLRSKAYGYRAETGIEKIVVFVEHYSDDTALLKEKLKGYLALPLIPERVIRVERFPLNVNGKVDKILLFQEHSIELYGVK